MGKHSTVATQHWALRTKTYTHFIFAGKHTFAAVHCSATLSIVIQLTATRGATHAERDVAFPLQQRSRGLTTMLRCTYVACLFVSLEIFV